MTVALDPDVRARIDRLCKERGVRMKVVINEAMRRGMDKLEAQPKPRSPSSMG
jgi:predicted transcriptional regulator